MVLTATTSIIIPLISQLEHLVQSFDSFIFLLCATRILLVIKVSKTLDKPTKSHYNNPISVYTSSIGSRNKLELVDLVMEIHIAEILLIKNTQHVIAMCAWRCYVATCSKISVLNLSNVNKALHCCTFNGTG